MLTIEISGAAGAEHRLRLVARGTDGTVAFEPIGTLIRNAEGWKIRLYEEFGSITRYIVAEIRDTMAEMGFVPRSGNDYIGISVEFGYGSAYS